MNKRIKSFIWRAGIYVAVALAGYLANIGNIQEIDLNKLATIFIVTISVFVLNEATKHLNTTESVTVSSVTKKSKKTIK